MNLKSIQDKLNKDFQGEGRKLIFWYDDQAEFAEEIDGLALDNAKIYRLQPDNLFQTKHFLEIEDTVANYLIYAPYPKPADQHNHLADMLYYSKQFFADKISLICVDLKIPEQFKKVLGHYQKFFTSNERVDKFVALGIENYEAPYVIETGLMAVLAKVKTPNFAEILKTILVSNDLDDNATLAQFEKMGLLPAFWNLCALNYGYKNDNSPISLKKLAASFLLTYTSQKYRGNFPKAWEPYLTAKRNDVTVFIDNLMNHQLHRESFNALAEKTAAWVQAGPIIKQNAVDDYLNCDAFVEFDRLIIEHLASLMAETSSPLPAQYDEILESRATLSHYAAEFAPYYRLLAHASRLIGLVADFDPATPKDIDTATQAYINQGAQIDRLYRYFYFFYDQIEPRGSLETLREYIEHLYTNAYLTKMNIAWAELLSDLPSLVKLPGQKQSDFYRHEIKPTVGRKAMVVIISDALRYECGLELHEILTEKAKLESKLGYMFSSLPSYTKLGMAALLPHQEITYSADFKALLIDGLPTETTEQRGNILQAQVADSAATTYDSVKNMSQADLRATFSGKKLIYVYHNQIDARGDKPATENEVFTACHEAIGEIQRLIERITSQLSFTNYLVTADHGFIYKRDKLDETDKLDLPKPGPTSVSSRRFILFRESPPTGGLSYPMDYLGGKCADVIVTMPRGTDVFKTAGGGQNYVHGGASPQEMIIPVIRVKTTKGAKAEGTVSLELASQNRKITNLITNLEFIQRENVTDVLKPTQIKVYFENAAGDKISGENIINADKKNSEPEARIFKEKFTLLSRRYVSSDTYYLVMTETKSNIELARHEFTIDIAFSDDFNFNL